VKRVIRIGGGEPEYRTPGHLFGANGEGHVRNAFAQSMAELEEALTRIRAALAKL